MFKFIHAADIHLDSPPRGLMQSAGAAGEGLRDVTRRALENLVSLAITERVAFVVISGDLYDGDWKDFNTGLFLARCLGRLREAGIRAYIVYGNHDAQSNMTKTLRWPEGVHVFPTTGGARFIDEQSGAALHGRSFLDRGTDENLVPSYGPPVAGAFNIGVLHTALEGNTMHATYAPTSVEELKNKGYDYWALGHVHARAVLCADPWIVFSGNLQGRHIREEGPKGATLVTVDEGRVVACEHVPLDVLRWRHLVVDAEGAASRSVVEDRVREAMVRAVADEAGGRTLAMRVTVRGSGRAHGELVTHAEAFTAELRAMALGLGGDVALVEKVRVEMTAARAAAGAAGGAGLVEETADELRRMFGDAPTDAELLALVKGDLDALRGKLPAEAIADLDPGPLDSLLKGRLDELVRDAAPLLLARLAGGEG